MNESTTRREHQLGRLRRFLSKVLRHQSPKFPVTLDAEGYADLADIMYILKRLPNFRWVRAQDVEEALGGDDSTHYELIRAGKSVRVRARYGHTATRPEYPPVEPPAVLYCAVPTVRVSDALAHGLKPDTRTYVHLASTAALAQTLAARDGSEPRVLRIDGTQARAQGITFYQASEGVYLADAIPATCIMEIE